MSDLLDKIPKEDIQCQLMYHLLVCIREMGWKSIVDTRVITPNIGNARIYIQKYPGIFDLTEFSNEISNEQFINRFNILFGSYWGTHIMGTVSNAVLKNFIKIPNFSAQ